MHDTVPNASTENLFCFEVRFTSRNTMLKSMLKSMFITYRLI